MTMPPPAGYVPPRRPRTGLYVGVAVAVVLLLGMVGAAAYVLGARRSTSAPTPAAAASAQAVESPAAPATESAETPPKPSDFTITVKILSKHCYGSAGCNVTFRIDVTYGGPALTQKYRVTYNLHGAEDPFSDSFTFDYAAKQITTESETMVSTKSSKAVLTATVADVLAE